MPVDGLRTSLTVVVVNLLLTRKATFATWLGLARFASIKLTDKVHEPWDAGSVCSEHCPVSVKGLACTEAIPGIDRAINAAGFKMIETDRFTIESPNSE